MSKISRDRAIENWCWKATSEREAICHHAYKILTYRRWADKLSAQMVWCLMVLFNAVLYLAQLCGPNWDKLEVWAILIVLLIYLDAMIGVMWVSVKMSKRPIYDWAEDYRDLLEEREAFRREEREQDLPRRKF